MANNITEYNATAGSNTTIDSISIDEGMAASNVNNAIRSLMSHLKNVDTGSQALTALSVTGNVSVGGTFTSRGIDDNADAVAITIDSSENVHIGKTSTGLSTAGLSLRGDADVAQFTRDGNAPLELNRLSSNGEILGFYKDSSLIGQISGTIGLIVGTGDTGLGFQTSTGDAIIPQRPDTQAGRDASLDIGNSSYRFKDLYLSGGVFLGGTGSANQLSDAEEGTWTPTLTGASSGTRALSSVTATYIKVGSMVTATISCAVDGLTGSASGGARLGGFPFNYNGSVSKSAGTVNFGFALLPSTSNMGNITLLQASSGTSNVFFWQSTFNNHAGGELGITAFQDNSDIVTSITYQAV